MSVLDRLDKMLKAGVPYDTALELARGFEADLALAVRETAAAVAAQLAQMPAPKSKAALRTEKWRAKQASQNVTEPSPRDGGPTVTERHETSPDRHPVTPPHVRGENNLSRLVDTCSAAVVVAEAREPVSDWPDGDANQHAKLLAQLAGTSRLDPSRQPGLATTAGRLAAWKRDGASWTYDVVPAVTIMSQKRGPPIATWKYFDPAIAQSIADNRRALDIPPANGPRHERPDPPSAKLAAKQANMERAYRGAQAVIARRAV